MRLIKFLAIFLFLAGPASGQDLHPDLEKRAKLSKINEYIMRKADEAYEAGVVYRPPMYWAHYRNHLEMRDAFQGKLEGISKNSLFFAGFFNAYVVAFSKECGQFLPSGSAEYTFERKRQVFTGWGFSYTDTVSKQVIGVRRDLQPFYEKFREHPNAGLGLNTIDLLKIWTYDELGRNELLSHINSNYVVPMMDFREFLRTEGCQSPATVQIEENLLRHAKGRASLQSSGETVPNYSSVTVRAAASVKAQDVVEACAITFIYEYDAFDICRCQGIYSQTLSEGDRATFLRYWESYTKNDQGMSNIRKNYRNCD